MNPILRVKALESVKFSKVKNDVGSGRTHWGEHFFINRVIEDKVELENQKIIIEVMDKNKLLKDSLIGEVVMSCRDVDRRVSDGFDGYLPD